MIHIVRQLTKKKVCYLGNITPSRRVGHALALASKFFEIENYVPGFGEMLCISNKENHSRILRKYEEEKRIFELVLRSRRNLPEFMPDLIWIDCDDEKFIEFVRKDYGPIPTIISNSKVSKDGMKILVDTREQKSLFDGDTLQKRTLIVGDYTTEKLLNKFHIERKSPEDLYGTITKGHVRFRNELIRADVNNIKLVMYVECSRQDFVDKKFPGGSIRVMSGETLGKIIDTVEHKYKMEVVWSGNRDKCKSQVLKRLKAEEQRQNGSDVMPYNKSSNKR